MKTRLYQRIDHRRQDPFENHNHVRGQELERLVEKAQERLAADGRLEHEAKMTMAKRSSPLPRHRSLGTEEEAKMAGRLRMNEVTFKDDGGTQVAPKKVDRPLRGPIR
jgi:hypothetical protein